MGLSEYRREFPILQQKIYLNTCSLGALSLRSQKYVQTFLREWNEQGASAWYSSWIHELDSVREMVAHILHADKDEIALGHSISTILGTLGSCFRFEKRKKVLVTDLDFPSANYQWLAKKPYGVTTNILRSQDKIHVPLELFQEAIDSQTALVSTSHIFFTSGQIQDITAINALARGHDSLCVFDAYQSVGQVPVHVRDMGIDMLISGGLKWLLGGTGITFLYVRKEIISSLLPTASGWFGTKNQFDFSPDNFELLENARRFETGTPSLASVFAFKGGLEIIREIGVESICTATKQLTDELIERLELAGFSLRIPRNREERSAIVMVRHPNPADAVGALRERNIIVDSRKDCVRVSPYFYNTSEDIDLFVTALKEIS